MTQAIILAAGQGTRLRPLTTNRPKCLVEIGEVPILHRQLAVLRECGITDITIVTGFEGDQIRPSGCRTIRNPAYATSNMVESLMCAEEVLGSGEDAIISYGDIVFEARVLRSLLQEDGSVAVTVDTSWRAYWRARYNDLLEDSETLKMGPSNLITEIGDVPTSSDDIDARYVGLLKIAAGSGRHLVDLYRNLDNDFGIRGRKKRDLYMTDFLQIMVDRGEPVHAACISGGWLEVDSVADVNFIEDRKSRGDLARFCQLAEPGELLCA